MTAGSNSQPFPLVEKTACPMPKEFPARPDSLAADDEARRLTTAISRGDEAAFRELYDRYQDRVYRLALLLSHGSESLSSETVQSVFVTAAAKLRSVESEAHLWNWLARVARQQLARNRRQLAPNQSIVAVADLPDHPNPQEPDALLEEQLDAALRDLDPDERRLIESFYFDGLSQRDLAQQLGTTAKAVSSRLERARARLRAYVNRRFQ